jgi:hypothetical protein
MVIFAGRQSFPNDSHAALRVKREWRRLLIVVGILAQPLR